MFAVRMHADVVIRHDLRPGDLGRIVTLHGEAYAPLPGFGSRFEACVASTIAEYVLDNDSRGRTWLAERDSKLLGCAAIALRDDNTAQLRWVVVTPSMRRRFSCSRAEHASAKVARRAGSAKKGSTGAILERLGQDQ